MLNKYKLKVNNIDDIFSYSYVMFDKDYKLCLIKVSDDKFRIKKEVQNFVNTCQYTVEDLESFLKEFNNKYFVEKIAEYRHFCLFEIKRTKNLNMVLAKSDKIVKNDDGFFNRKWFRLYLPKKKLLEVDDDIFFYHYVLNDLSLHKKMYLIYNAFDENKKPVCMFKLARLICKRKNFSLSELKFNFTNIFNFVVLYEDKNNIVIELTLKSWQKNQLFLIYGLTLTHISGRIIVN